MRRMMRLMFAGMILVASNGLMAQENVPGPGTDNKGEMKDMSAEDRARKRTDQMKTELTLTTTQEEVIYAINLAHIVEMDKLRAEQKALREKMKAENESTKAKINAVLTPEQNVIFNQKAEEHKKKQEERRAEDDND